MSGDPNERLRVDRFLRTRDEAAFRDLYRSHAAAVHAFVGNFIGARDPEVPDLVQDVWIRAADALPRFEWRSSLRTWLIGIAVNRCREHLRERQAAHEGIDENTGESDVSSDPVSLAAVDRIDLARSVAALPLGYREVIVLHDIHGYTHDEVAQILGIATGTSKSQLSRARRTLRTALSRRP